MQVAEPIMGPLTFRQKLVSLQNGLKKFTDERTKTELRLAKFDSLDFDYYNNQRWNMLARSHAGNIKCYYPDGSTITGLYPQHIDQLKPMFVFAPDSKCKSHVARFGGGEWTCVIKEVEGTFSKPIPIGNGKAIAPTGKHFKFSLATVGHGTRQHVTERAFTAEYCELFAPGVYDCICCGTQLFDSITKFDSGTGWPSFTEPVKDNVMRYKKDNSWGNDTN